MEDKDNNSTNQIQERPQEVGNPTNGQPTAATTRPNIYHERQSKQLCALHTLNNLFQAANVFSKKDLDVICTELAPNSRFFNPHRSALGMGCYDINVIIAALAKRGFEAIWFDKRKNLQQLNMDNIFGFILNVPNKPSNGLLSIPLDYIPVQAQVWSSQKHWIAIKKIESHYYDLDSKLDSPYRIGSESDLLQYLSPKNTLEQVEIFIIVPKHVEEDQSWFKATSTD